MTPVLLLPGMMCDARLFLPQIAALSARRTLAVPMLGRHDSMAALAAEVLAHAPPRFALLGLSMGGIVAMEVLRQAPERVERLALLDTNPRAEAPEVRAGREPQVARVLAGGLPGLIAEIAPSYLADPARADIVETCVAMALALGPQVFARQSRALAGRPDQQPTLAAFRGPALVLTGEADRLCPRHRHELMHALIQGSRLSIIAGAGHLPTLEQPEATNAEIIRWLEE
jgi:pimeloyl-ACP methyl ester carboxylesterase